MGIVARVLDGVQGGRTSTGVPILTAFAVGIARFTHASANLAVRCDFQALRRAAWGGGGAHLLFQTLGYIVVCLVLWDRHVENATARRMLGLLRRAGPGCAPCALIVSLVVHAARAHAERWA